ncbi:MAG: TlpA family protein disulfide reductase [Bacteroidetes bacterium]|nr:TlpA family protein disulfide reductase [Bacteroidota bacterium]
MRFFLSLVLPLMLYSPDLSAGHVVINGSAPGFENQPVKLVTVTDLISNLEITLDNDTISANSGFSLSADVSEICFAWISIFNVKAYIYLEPGKTYNISLLCKDELTDSINSRLYSVFPIETVPIFEAADSTDLNVLLGDFNYLYNVFILDNVDQLITGRKKQLVDSLKLAMFARFSVFHNPYLNNYINYRFAGLEMMQQIGGKETIAMTYLATNPILYNNTEYIAFISEYFKHYFALGSLIKRNEELHQAINVERSYASLIRLMRADSVIIENAELRELVMLKGLYEIFNNPAFDKEAIREIMEFVKAKSQIPTDKIIAGSLISKLYRFEKGTIVKDFALQDWADSTYSLSQYKGKFVYLLFWTSWCTPCLREMAMLESFREKYSDWFVFIGIMTDGNKQMMKKTATTYKFQFPFLHVESQPDLPERFGVISFPTGVFIDPDGKLITQSARLPSTNLEALIREVYFILKENEKSKTPHTFNKLWDDMD